MMEYFPHLINHMFPGIPGGPMTVLEIIAVMLILLILWRRTKWAGWLAFLIAAGFYARHRAGLKMRSIPLAALRIVLVAVVVFGVVIISNHGRARGVPFAGVLVVALLALWSFIARRTTFGRSTAKTPLCQAVVAVAADAGMAPATVAAVSARTVRTAIRPRCRNALREVTSLKIGWLARQWESQFRQTWT